MCQMGGKLYCNTSGLCKSIQRMEQHAPSGSFHTCMPQNVQGIHPPSKHFDVILTACHPRTIGVAAVLSVLSSGTPSSEREDDPKTSMPASFSTHQAASQFFIAVLSVFRGASQAGIGLCKIRVQSMPLCTLPKPVQHSHTKLEYDLSRVSKMPRPDDASSAASSCSSTSNPADLQQICGSLYMRQITQ